MEINESNNKPQTMETLFTKWKSMSLYPQKEQNSAIRFYPPSCTFFPRITFFFYTVLKKWYCWGRKYLKWYKTPWINKCPILTNADKNPQILHVHFFQGPYFFLYTIQFWIILRSQIFEITQDSLDKCPILINTDQNSQVLTFNSMYGENINNLEHLLLA